jgi:hypothetical protein
LEAFLIGVVVWRRFNPHPRKSNEGRSSASASAPGFGSPLLG